MNRFMTSLLIILFLFLLLIRKIKIDHFDSEVLPKIKIPFVVKTRPTTHIETNLRRLSNGYTLNVPTYDSLGFSGRGLVITGSGSSYRYTTGIYTNVYLIRKVHKSTIPIEIFYVSSSEKFPERVEKALLELGNIRLVDLLDRIQIDDYPLDKNQINELRGYQTKPLACLCSSFSEVILMDADAISFIDPIELFNIRGYDSHGMVLFKDYVKCLKYVSEDFINNIGITANRYCLKTGGFEIDSSCVIVDKKRALDALYAICLINFKSEQYYPHEKSSSKYNVLGDKDTWLIGSMFVGFDPFIDTNVNPQRLSVNDTDILGHFQRGHLHGVVVPLYYNNQQLKLEGIDNTNIKTIQFRGSPLPKIMETSLLECKNAITTIIQSIPPSILSQRPVYSSDLHYFTIMPT